jgi:hypothetical protein
MFHHLLRFHPRQNQIQHHLDTPPCRQFSLQQINKILHILSEFKNSLLKTLLSLGLPVVEINCYDKTNGYRQFSESLE